MRYLFKIVAIVAAFLMMALAVCSGDDHLGSALESALECSELPAQVTSPVADLWGEGSPCAGDSRTSRYKALANRTVVDCDPAIRVAAIWQNAQFVELKGDEAVAYCVNLCRDPAAPDDSSRCSALCSDATDPARCDPLLTGLAWRLPETAELESLKNQVNGHACTIQGCRLDANFAGDCDYYWAADLAEPDDPTGSERSFSDMRGGGSGFDRIDKTHSVRCVANRL